MARHYLDYGSAAPVRPEVVAQLTELLPHLGADPGRLHAEALVVRDLIEQSREVVASYLGVAARRVIFTSGIAESIASATFGVLSRSAERGVAASALERSAVLANAGRYGTHLAVGTLANGQLDLESFAAALNGGAGLAWCQLANQETGILQPLAEAATLAAAASVPLACDLSGGLPYALPDAQVDVLVAGAEAFGAPAGVGILVLREPLRLEPLLIGGAQERARRAGLENTLGICALAAAVRASEAQREAEAARLAELQVRVDRGLSAVAGVRLIDGGGSSRVPSTSCFTVDGVEAEAVLVALERRGVAVHSGSACASEALEASPVLAAMGLDANHGLRITTGWATTHADVDALLESFEPAVSELRALRA